MDEAWELAERSGDPLAIAFVIHDTGNVLFDVGDNEGARVKFAHALACFGRQGSGLGVAQATMNLGNVAEATGDLDDAYDQFMASFDMLRRQHRHQVGSLAGIAALNLANILAGRGESEKAFEFLAVGVRNAQAFPSSYTLLATAMVASASGHREAALVLHGAASAYLVGAAAGETSTRLLRNDLEALRADGSLDVDDLYESGRRMPEDEALRFAVEFVARHTGPNVADTAIDRR
jgi:tetratricopeptide (TPR) repeat protein